LIVIYYEIFYSLNLQSSAEACPSKGKRASGCPYTGSSGFGKKADCPIFDKMAQCRYGSKLKDCPKFSKMKGCPSLVNGCPLFGKVNK